MVAMIFLRRCGDDGARPVHDADVEAGPSTDTAASTRIAVQTAIRSASRFVDRVLFDLLGFFGNLTTDFDRRSCLAYLTLHDALFPLPDRAQLP